MKAMNYEFTVRYPLRQVGLATLAIVFSCTAAAAAAVYRSPTALLLVVSGICMMAALVVWIRKPIWALYAALVTVFLPIGILPTTWQSNANRVMTVAAFGVWLLTTINYHRRVTLTNTAWWMLAFIVWSSATLIWAEDLGGAWIGIQTYVLRFVLFIVLFANQLQAREQLDGLMRTLALCGWILLAASVTDIVMKGYSPGERLRVFGMNENATGMIALITMVGVLWAGSQTQGRPNMAARIAGFTFIGLALVVTAATGSRGSALSFLIALAAFWLWCPTRLWGMLGMILLLGAVALCPSIFATLSARLAVERGDTLLGNRETLWQGAWRLILDHPWLGVGINNAPRTMVRYAGAARGIGQYQTVPIHNPVLTIWAETGLIGILLYLGVLASALLAFVRSWVRDRRADDHWLMPYYGLVAAVTLGYLASWIKGGGIESDRTYFLVLAMLVLPSQLTDARSRKADSAVATTSRASPVMEGRAP